MSARDSFIKAAALLQQEFSFALAVINAIFTTTIL
jgi:hypothetical protein